MRVAGFASEGHRPKVPATIYVQPLAIGALAHTPRSRAAQASLSNARRPGVFDCKSVCVALAASFPARSA